MIRAALTLILLAAPLGAQPPTAAPPRLWGLRFQPGTAAASIFVNATGVCDSCDVEQDPWAFDADVLGGRLFLAAGPGPCVFELANPMRPSSKLCSLGKATNTAKGIPIGVSDENFYFTSIAASTASLFVTNVKDQGFAVWGVRQGGLDVHYHNPGLTVVDVATVTDNGNHLGLALVTSSQSGTTPPGIALYDLDEAAKLTKCSSAGDAGTCGVLAAYLGVPGGNLGSMDVYGGFAAVRVRGTDLQVYRLDFDDFAKSPLLMSEELRGPGGAAISTAGEVALLRRGEALSLWTLTARTGVTENDGIRNVSSLNVHDVTCLDRGACTLPPAAVSYLVPDYATSSSRQSILTRSEVGGRAYLSVGNEDSGRGTCQNQRHYLLDVTDFHPSDTLAELDVVPERLGSWYYPECFDAANPDTAGFKEWTPYRYVVGPGNDDVDVAYGINRRVADASRVILAADTGKIFSDGFESGTTEGWMK